MLRSFIKDIQTEKKAYKEVRDIKYIIWDGAKIHVDASVNKLLNENKIRTRLVNTEREPRAPLRVVDRVIRTMRDLVNKYANKQPDSDIKVQDLITKNLVDYYNKSPHDSLELMTNIRRLTPWNVHRSEVLERQIIVYCQSWNWNMNQKPNLDLKVGDKVLVKDLTNNIGYKKRGKYLEGEFTIIRIETFPYGGNKYVLKSSLTDHNLVTSRPLIVKVK